jgi:hypothetical protein
LPTGYLPAPLVKSYGKEKSKEPQIAVTPYATYSLGDISNTNTEIKYKPI